MSAGAELLRRRVLAIPDCLRRFDLGAAPLPELGGAPPRFVVATGAGSSLENARFLTSLLGDALGVPARCAPPSALLGAPPEGAEEDLLVVFSQGLSPNGRAPLAHAGAWRGALLVTGESAGTNAEATRCLAAFAAAGGRILRTPAPPETGLLLRVIGPLLGALAAIELARAIAATRGVSAPWPRFDGDTLAAALEAAGARGRALRAALPGDPLAGALALLAGGSRSAGAGGLARKLLEGLRAPLPPVFDLLDFAHGGFQQLFEEPATLLALTSPDAPEEEPLLARAEAMLDVSRHRLLRLAARLPAPYSLLEHEALLNELLLAAVEARGQDPGRWPGQDRDAPLYALEAPPPAEPPAAPRELARLVWPELAALLAAGARTAVVPLGSTEQHGPHLPFATDTWLADALAEGFCARVPEALRLPALPFGCASEHLSFPGTLHLRAETLAALLEDLVLSLDRHGFRHIFVFSAHGGNGGLLRGAAERLERAAERAQVIVCADPGVAAGALFARAAELGVGAAAAGHHAGEIETSLLLALAPADVRSEAMQSGRLAAPGEGPALFYPDLRANAPNGVVGDPRGARAARAGCYLAAWLEVLVRTYEDAKKLPCTKGTSKP